MDLDLSEYCSKNNKTIGFLGSREGVVQRVSSILIKQSKHLNIAFTHHGYFNKTLDHPENEAVISAINAAKPDILLVGFGMPIQEKWIMENFDRLDVKVFLPVGAAFDYISGNVPRAPRWMTDHGLEWLGRLIIEPRRLWKRYLIGIPLFFWRVLKQRLGILKTTRITPMLRRFSTNFAIFSILLDGFLITLALYLSVYLRAFANRFSFVRPLPELSRVPFELYLIFPIVWLVTFLVFNIYDGRKNIRVIDEFSSLTFGAFLATVTSAGVLYLTYRDISRFQFALFAITAFLFLLIWRSIIRTTVHRKYSKKIEMRKVLILGAGTAGRSVGQQIKKESMYGLQVVGYLDDNPKKQKEVDVVGDLDIARTIISSTQIDDVVVALPLSAHQRLNQIVSDLHDLPVRVWIIPDYFSLNTSQSRRFRFCRHSHAGLTCPGFE